MSNEWSKQGIKTGCVMLLEFSNQSHDLGAYILGYDSRKIQPNQKDFFLVDLVTSKIVVTSNSIDKLRLALETSCNAKVKVKFLWRNIYELLQDTINFYGTAVLGFLGG